MKTIAIAGLAALVALSTATIADAKPGKKRKPVRHHSYQIAKPYPYATERQRQNTLAYESGGYYERIQSAHVFGSRGWWELQNRGGGNRR